MFLERLIKRIRRKFSKPSTEEKRLQEIYDIFASSPDSGWIVSWKEAKKIHQLIKIRNSKNALELGTGIGTAAAIMANAMGENGKVTTLEQSEKCLHLARMLIPPELKRKINFVLSEPCVLSLPILKQGEKISGYKKLPVEFGPFDFVLVDGPGTFEENGEKVRHPNGDLFSLIPHIIPHGIVFVDNRKKALAFYLKYLLEYFTVGGSWSNYCFLERTAKKWEK